MDIELSQCFIAVDGHGHDKALTLHRDALGLEVRNRARPEGVR